MKTQQEWRCSRCGKLLGVFIDNRIHIKFVRSHEYLVGLPATGTCRACGTLNQSPDPKQTAANGR